MFGLFPRARTGMPHAQNRRHTHLFRHTDVLLTARAQLADRNEGRLKILSFGCSTGDEIVTLRAIFPNAAIYGCDIDHASLAVAARMVGHLATLIPSDGAAIEAHGPFDFINCSAVLCRNPPTRIRSRFPSARFDALLTQLDRALAPSGLIAITNASYRFCASPIAPRYDPVRSDIVFASGFIDVFAHDGTPFLERATIPSQVAYRRGAAFRLADEEELADSLFRKRPSGEPSTTCTLSLAPVPARFVEAFAFEQSNLTGVTEARRAKVIEVVRRYRFGHDERTGEHGYSLQIGWRSRAEGELYFRRPFWQTMPGPNTSALN